MINEKIAELIFKDGYKHVEVGDQAIAWGMGFLNVDGTDTVKRFAILRTYVNCPVDEACPNLYVGSNVTPTMYDQFIKRNEEVDSYVPVGERDITVMEISEISHDGYAYLLFDTDNMTMADWEEVDSFAESFGVSRFFTTNSLLNAGLYTMWSKVYVPLTPGAHGPVPCLWVVDDSAGVGGLTFNSINADDLESYADMFSVMDKLAEQHYMYYNISESGVGSVSVVFNRSYCSYAGRLSNECYIRPIIAALHHVDDSDKYIDARKQMNAYLTNNTSTIPGAHIISDSTLGNVQDIDAVDCPPKDPMAFVLWAAGKGK